MGKPNPGQAGIPQSNFNLHVVFLPRFRSMSIKKQTYPIAPTAQVPKRKIGSVTAYIFLI
jgi:hypothetical protein